MTGSPASKGAKCRVLEQGLSTSARACSLFTEPSNAAADILPAFKVLDSSCAAFSCSFKDAMVPSNLEICFFEASKSPSAACH